jgi:hypothetical protein
MLVADTSSVCYGSYGCCTVVRFSSTNLLVEQHLLWKCIGIHEQPITARYAKFSRTPCHRCAYAILMNITYSQLFLQLPFNASEFTCSCPMLSVQ